MSAETSITTYKLVAFKSSKDKDFAKAQKLYVSSIDGPSLTDPNQIAYCVDHYNEFYKDAHFVVAGLYQNRQLIGYCQFIYLNNEKLVFIDYIIIDPAYRGLNIFYSFLEKIREYIFINNFDIKYTVGEINIQYGSDSELPRKSKLLIKLLKSNNFGRVKSDYFQPMLGAENYESELESILMLYPADQYNNIKKETFIQIIDAIYFKHYERWFKLFLTEKEFHEYKKHIHDMYKKVIEKASSSKPIALEREDDFLGEQEIKGRSEYKPKTLFILLLGFIFIVIVIGGLYLLIKHFTNLGLEEIKNILYISGAFLLLIAALVFKKAQILLGKLIEKIIEKVA